MENLTSAPRGMGWIRLALVVAASVGLLFVDVLLLPSRGFSLLGFLVQPLLVWFAIFLGIGLVLPAWSAARRAVLAWAVYLLAGVGALLAISGGQTEMLLLVFMWPSYVAWIAMCQAGLWCPFS